MNKQLHLVVTGLVQGVGYRHATMIKARQLKLTGWVKNLANGNVEVLAQGEETDLNQLHDWALQGPALARVKNIQARWESSFDSLESFDIAR